MKDSQQRQTISSGLRGNRGRYNLDSPPPAAHISYKPEMVGKQYGCGKDYQRGEKRWNEKWNRCYVLTECSSCHSIQWTLLSNLTRGISRGCQTLR